jgi:hypothetical protein
MTNPNVLVAKEGIVLCALGTRWSVLSILPTSVGSGRVVDDLSTYPLGGRCKSQTAQEFLCQHATQHDPFGDPDAKCISFKKQS